MAFLNPKVLGFLFTSENRRDLLHEWTSHLELFSRPQVLENSRQYLLLLDRKHSLGALP